MARLGHALDAVVAVTLVAGLWLANTSPRAFARYMTDEDGLVEWATVVALAVACLLCWGRVWRLRRRRPRLFLGMTAFAGLAFFWAAGEEISWGQRLLGLRTPAYFARHNAQHEITLHNMVIGGVRVQAWLERLFWLEMFILLVAVPLAYRHLPWARRLLARLAVPVPRVRHAIVFALCHLVAFMNGPRRWEVFEFLAAVVIVMILAFPCNGRLFDPTCVVEDLA